MKVPENYNEKLKKQSLMHGQSFKNFLEKYPLHKKNNIAIDFNNFTFLALQLNCRNCKKETTHSYYEYKSDIKPNDLSRALSRQGTKDYPTENTTYKFCYKCELCQVDHYYFQITFQGPQFYKTGQHPSIEINVPSDIEDKLGVELSKHYKNGKMCYAHGLGIAAMAYYRRVIEDKVKELLIEIEALVPDQERDKYLAAIKDVADLHSFESKADLIYEAMPTILRPKGNNYLKLLFSKVSEGLHSKSDDECLKIANDVSQLLEVIIHTLNQQAEAVRVIERIGNSLKNSDSQE